MATRFIVHAISGGTGIKLTVSGWNPSVALARAQTHELAKTAEVFICTERATGLVVGTSTRKILRHSL
jgi:hypothetical protein